MTESPFDATRWQAALVHQGRLLALAERLLGDPAAAEDAVEHALLQESRGRRRADVPPLPFLRRVVQNVARRFRRDAATRTRHEAAAAVVGEALPADELAARERLRRCVADAVLALAEPYRTTVALVHLEEVPPAEVARRLGIAEATVRVRLHRARGDLRRRLDRDFGSRGAWALVPWWRSHPVSAPAGVVGGIVGGIVMKKLFVVAVVTLLLLGVGAFALRNGSEGSPPPAEVVQGAAVDIASPPATRAERVPAAPQSAPADPAPAAPSQAFRCIDEQGQPVAGAEVRLRRLPYGCGAPDLVATSDAEGRGTFADVVPAAYGIDAKAGHRLRVQDPDPSHLPRSGPPLELLLRELWIGGIEMPGVEIVDWSGSLAGFRATDASMAGPRAERELTEAWRSKHPGAQFWAGVRDAQREPSPTIRMEIEWFGHARVPRDVRMWPASTFPGPERVDPDAVPRTPWASARVLFVDREGAPLPAALQAALRTTSGLAAVGPRFRGLQGYRFPTGEVKLPAGDYELRLFDAATSQMRAGARCTAAATTTELRLPVDTTDRVVHVAVRGVGAGYVLIVVHESGRTARELGRPDGLHTLLLPPGPCMLTVGSGESRETQRKTERPFVVTTAAEQDVAIDVPPAK